MIPLTCPVCGAECVVTNEEILAEIKDSPRMKALLAFEDAEDNLQRAIQQGDTSSSENELAMIEDLTFALKDWLSKKTALDSL